MNICRCSVHHVSLIPNLFQRNYRIKKAMFSIQQHPAGNYMAIKITERRTIGIVLVSLLCLKCSSVSIVNFEQVNVVEHQPEPAAFTGNSCFEKLHKIPRKMHVSESLLLSPKSPTQQIYKNKIPLRVFT